MRDHKARQKVRELTVWHQVGQASRRVQQGQKADGPAAVHGATTLSLTQSNLRVARRFADPVAGYSVQDLKELLAQCRRHRRPWGIAHLVLLLTIRRKAERRQIQRWAIREGWSYARLRTHLRTRYGHRRASGRRPTVPRDRGGLLAHLAAACDSWRRLIVEINRKGASGQASAAAELPAKVRLPLARATKSLAALQNVIEKTLGSRRPRSRLEH